MQAEPELRDSPRRIALFFALRRESMYFLRTVPKARRLPNPTCAAWRVDVFGLSLVILETGVGRENARRAFAWLERETAKEGQIESIVCAGFGGALDRALKVGDVIQAGQVVEEDDREWPLLASAAAPSRLLTCGELVADPTRKESLAQRYRAQVVDMESAEVARLCEAKRLPLVCFRAISDDAATELSPHLIPLLSSGRVSPIGLAGALLRRPLLLLQLLRLERATRRAGRNLASSLRRYLQNLGRT